jgi:hypothetical protein
MRIRQKLSRNGMTKVVALTLFFLLAACGVETAGSAATTFTIKKNEIDAGQKTMGQAKVKIEDAVQQMQRRAEKEDDNK